MRSQLCMIIGLVLGTMLVSDFSAAQSSGTPLTSAEIKPKDRAHLPLPNTIRPELITYDAKSPDTKLPPIPQVRPPKGAPVSAC